MIFVKNVKIYYCHFLWLQARVVLYEEGAEVLNMTFNVVGKTNLNWFSKKSLLLSPWDDLKTTVELQFFAIRGSTNAKRSFEVTKRYGGCKKDAGWLVISGIACKEWEKIYPWPSILYSKQSIAVKFVDHGKQIFSYLHSTLLVPSISGLTYP